MPQAPDLTPAIDAVVEQVYCYFDFSEELADGVTIVSVTSVTCEVFNPPDGDPTPSLRLIGSPVIVSSPTSSKASAAVAQLIGTMIGGVVYCLACLIVTSDGQSLNVWSRLPCDIPC